jgi:SAM-dependent methyltransferase
MSNRKGPPHSQVLDLVSGKIISRAISLAADLALADHLIGGPRSADDLAQELSLNADALFRLMRTLESVGIFCRTTDGAFQNSELSEALRSDHPQSVRAYARWFGTDLHWDVWKQLDYSLSTGQPALTRQHPGSDPFEVLANHPAAHQVFLEAMTGFTLSEAMEIVHTLDFSGYESLMDVGGAHGALALAIHRKYPELVLSVFDLEHVLDGAEQLKGTPIKKLSGSFFEPMPGNVDACILKHVIHDWDDGHSVTILKNCASILNPGGEIIICEMLVHSGPGHHVVKTLDLEMLVGPGGRERTEEQFSALFEKAGLCLDRVVRTPSPLAVVVARVPN